MFQILCVPALIHGHTLTATHRHIIKNKITILKGSTFIYTSNKFTVKDAMKISYS